MGLWELCSPALSRVGLPGVHVAACQRRLMSTDLPGKQGQEFLGSLIQLMPCACLLAG